MRARWFSKKALLWHLALVIWFPGCLVAAWWQINVALGGDGLAYLYSVEWPVFAVFGVVFWWHILHDDPDTLGARGLRRLQMRRSDDAKAASQMAPLRREVDNEDEQLAEYNDYLAGLAARGEQKAWRKS